MAGRRDDKWMIVEEHRTNMKSQIIGLRVAGTVFALVCLGHLLRIITQVDVLIGGQQIPVWVNVVGVLIAGGLSLWMWRLSARSYDQGATGS
jgi:hypothetical protein